MTQSLFPAKNFSDGEVHNMWITFTLGTKAVQTAAGNSYAAKLLPKAANFVSTRRLGELSVYLDDTSKVRSKYFPVLDLNH